MTIPLPSLFEAKLRGHDQERGFVYSALTSFDQWFENSGTPFFRDYTDHGAQHLSSVLQTTAAMIPHESLASFSVTDATVFVFAALLHDSALHLTEPGVHQLIHGEAREHQVTFFQDAPWPAVWHEFLFAERRWNDEKLALTFGDDFVEQGHVVSDPFDRWGNLTQADYKLIGEFIRLHHARLAHEFAVFGVPGVRGTFLTLPAEVPAEWKDLSGVIARSHGLPLRDCLEYLESKPYNYRAYQGIHPIYLMSLLRLADYLQLDAGRAPEIVFRFRVVPSRASHLEWRSHHAVQNITPLNEDPESVEINARPPDVETYLRVRDWIAGIQTELDTSWAVLGEVYGRYPEVHFGLHWRRVKSNLDNRTTFVDVAPYVPRRIRLEVARAELLSLLIRPLYGDDPSFGVRELIQNAVDAVRECDYFLSQHPGCMVSRPREQEADVVVWLGDFDQNTGCAWLEVSDRGIGMTESVLVEYFLTAGASYRHSDQWQQTFERSDIPADASRPRAQVLRAGRFGVGVLAAFLLGDVIEVETRHVTSESGFRFRTSLTQDTVQVDRVRDLPVGTRVRVKVSREAFQKLENDNPAVSKPGAWAWYVLNNPRVTRLVGNRRTPVEGGVTFDLTNWQVAETELPITIHWRFFRNTDRRSRQREEGPGLSCNGLFISNSAKLPKIQPKHCNSRCHTVETPQIHVADPDGYLRLNLTRRELLSRTYGFEHDLFVSIVKHFLAHVLARFPESFAPEQIMPVLKTSPILDTFYSTARSVVPGCALSKNGFCLTLSGAVKAALKRVLWLTSVPSLQLVRDITPWDCVVLEQDLVFSDVRAKVFGSGLGSFRRTDTTTVTLGEHDRGRTRGCTSSRREGNLDEEWVYWEKKTHVRDEETREYRKAVMGMETRWLVSTPDVDVSEFPFETLLRRNLEDPSRTPFVADIVFPNDYGASVPPSIIDRVWNRLFGEDWIPWEKEAQTAQEVPECL